MQEDRKFCFHYCLLRDISKTRLKIRSDDMSVDSNLYIFTIAFLYKQIYYLTSLVIAVTKWRLKVQPLYQQLCIFYPSSHSVILLH